MDIKSLVIICIIFSAMGFPVLAVMSSSNFRIDADSINIGGTDEGSANYRVNETIGETATGESSSENYNLNAGLRPMLDGGTISITAPDDVTMSPVIPGESGGTGNGSAAWTVKTDAAAGYTLKISADGDPALRCSYGGCGSESFSDYSAATPGEADFDWLIDSSSAEFGLTPEGDDIVQKYRDNGVACDTGSLDTPDKCWYGVNSGQETIAESDSPNQQTGTQTTVKFRAQSGTAHQQAEGGYQATITVTAIPN